MSVLHLIDRLASRWLSFRTAAAVRRFQADGEHVELKRASIENGNLEMLLLAPGVFELASDAAALLNAANAQNYVEFTLMPRIDRAVKPILLTVQWAQRLSPAQKATHLQNELDQKSARVEAVEAECTLLRTALNELRKKLPAADVVAATNSALEANL